MATYTIKAGDTLSSIASNLGTNVQTLENLNPGVNPDDLQIGQVINVPGTSQYTIVEGDTFSSIASNLGTNVQTLENLNPGVNPNDLQIGQVVSVPGTSQYTIVEGDTFNFIASNLGTNVQNLENLNPGVNPNDLQIGQVINVPTGPAPGPIPEPDPTANGYVPYSGPTSNFPDQSSWADYQSLWEFNSSIIPSISFAGFEDVFTSVNIIGTFVPSIAAESGVDARVILCIIMQESGGNVLVHTTTSPGPSPVSNTGIMQAHDGADGATLQQDPWPAPVTIIRQMIKDGTEGTATGPGLMQLFNQYNNWYEAARAYNSGSVDLTHLSNGLGATDSYEVESHSIDWRMKMGPADHVLFDEDQTIDAAALPTRLGREWRLRGRDTSSPLVNLKCSPVTFFMNKPADA